jgi:hypothetical protein
MEIKRSRSRRRVVRVVFAAMALSMVTAIPWSDSNAQAGPAYSIDYHYISAGANRLHNSCFVVSGTVGQPVPGSSFGSGYSISAGFWAAAPIAGQDQLFFDGFERCGP